MWHTLASFVRYYCAFLVLFFLFLAVFIFSGFFLHIYINSWSLIIAFAVYVLCGGLYLAARHSNFAKYVHLTLFALLTVVAFLLGTVVFAQTYDTSFDGQSYHETGIIALANKWNPIYQSNFPIKTPLPATATLDQGSPKIVWSIDASIYKLTHNIDSATVINLFAGFVALIFAWDGLRAIGLSNRWAGILSFLVVVNTLFIQQLFSFMEDDLAYNFLVIGLASLVFLKRGHNKFIYLLCLFTSFIFLAGSKFSNLYVFLALGSIAIYIIMNSKIYRQKRLWVISIVGVLFGLVTLFNPYITNITHYHSIDYPYNQGAFASSLRLTGAPVNIRQDSKLELFYYGVFSSAELSPAAGQTNYAKLKVPFTFNRSDLLDQADETSKLVGGYGVFFSGIFLLSLISYIYLACLKRSKHNLAMFRWLTVSLALIILTCLLSPIPNYARYNNQLYLVPVAIIIYLLLVRSKHFKFMRPLAIILTICMLFNIYFDILPAILLRQTDLSAINYQLSTLKRTHQTYLVHADTFYSTYVKLESHDVKIKIVAQKLDPRQGLPVTCQKPTELFFSDRTDLCPITK